MSHCCSAALRPCVTDAVMIALLEHSSDGSDEQEPLEARFWSEWRKPSVCPSSCATALLKSPLLKISEQFASPLFISTSPSSVVTKVSPPTVFVPLAEVMPPMPSVPL